MELTELLFNLINPDTTKGTTGVNELSMRYHWWLSDRKKALNEKAKNNDGGRFLYFDVPGAGEIQIGKDCHSRTGNVVGFSFAVSWDSGGFLGGVLGRSDAKRLAEYILQKCSEVTETEQEELDRVREADKKFGEMIDELYKNRPQ